MQVWLISFLLLFAMAELLQWLRQFSLPLPIFVLGGVCVAIASNYRYLSNLPLQTHYENSPTPPPPAPPNPTAGFANAYNRGIKTGE
jgi:hypothetical protein